MIYLKVFNLGTQQTETVEENASQPIQPDIALNGTVENGQQSTLEDLSAAVESSIPQTYQRDVSNHGGSTSIIGDVAKGIHVQSNNNNSRNSLVHQSTPANVQKQATLIQDPLGNSVMNDENGKLISGYTSELFESLKFRYRKEKR